MASRGVPLRRDEAVPGRGDPPPPGEASGRGPRIASARIAVIMLLATETMFFTGLIGAYLVLRFGAATGWPPPDQPRLPVAVTGINSLFLLASAWTMHRSTRALRHGDLAGLKRALGVTAALGTLFLLVQGSEWVRLVGHGLTLASSVYGATFYTVIGCHGVHVLAAVVWLLLVNRAARRGRYSPRRRLGVELCATYWYYVCALWLLLFPLVYLV